MPARSQAKGTRPKCDMTIGKHGESVQHVLLPCFVLIEYVSSNMDSETIATAMTCCSSLRAHHKPSRCLLAYTLPGVRDYLHRAVVP